MKNFLFLILFTVANLTSVCQGINSKAIEITNADSENYTAIVGTKLKLRFPNGFTRRNATTYEHTLAGSYISVQKLEGDVNTNFYTFDKKSMYNAGIIVVKETFFKINGFEAMMIDGDQFIDGKELAVSILLIGNAKETYMIMGSTPIPIQNNMKLYIATSLLSVIFDPTIEITYEGLFDYSVNAENFGLKEVSPMGETRTFTDDGNFPSRTNDKTSVTIREYKINGKLDTERQTDLCAHRFEQYPVTWDEKYDLTPRKFQSEKLEGYEIFASGVNKFLQTEFIYQLILFADDRYFVVTGMSFGDENKCMEIFRGVANSLRY